VRAAVAYSRWPRPGWRRRFQRSRSTSVVSSSSLTRPSQQPCDVDVSPLPFHEATSDLDAYGDDEQYTAFLTVIEDQTAFPLSATLLDTTVRVTAWIHAAYRHCLLLPPFPVTPRPDWSWPD
jgi:hypothetical protein